MVGEMNALVEFLGDTITDVVTYLPWRVTRVMFAIACIGVAIASVVTLLDGPVPTAAGNGRWWLIASRWSAPSASSAPSGTGCVTPGIAGGQPGAPHAA